MLVLICIAGACVCTALILWAKESVSAKKPVKRCPHCGLPYLEVTTGILGIKVYVHGKDHFQYFGCVDKKDIESFEKSVTHTEDDWVQ